MTSQLFAEYRDGKIVAVHEQDQGEGQCHTPIADSDPDYLAYMSEREESRLDAVEVTPLQLRRALRQLGVLSAVNAYVDAQSDEVKEAWEYAVKMPAGDPMLKAACAALNVDRAALFALAATL